MVYFRENWKYGEYFVINFDELAPFVMVFYKRKAEDNENVKELIISRNIQITWDEI